MPAEATLALADKTTLDSIEPELDAAVAASETGKWVLLRALAVAFAAVDAEALRFTDACNEPVEEDAAEPIEFRERTPPTRAEAFDALDAFAFRSGEAISEATADAAEELDEFKTVLALSAAEADAAEELLADKETLLLAEAVAFAAAEVSPARTGEALKEAVACADEIELASSRTSAFKFADEFVAVGALACN